MTAPHPEHRRALLGLLLANLFWAVSFPLVKGMALVHGQLLPESGNWFITAMMVGPRFLLAAIVLGLWAPRTVAGATGAELRQGLLLGLCNALGMLFQVDGLQFTSASVSAFLTQFSALMIPVVVALRHRRLPAPVVWLCAVMVLAGVAILGRFDFRTLQLGRGEIETLLSSVFFMAQIFVLESPRHAGNRVLPVSAVMFGLEGVLFAGLAFATAPHAADYLVPWTSAAWTTSTLILTGFCTLGAFMLMNRWQPKVTATEAGLIYCLESVFASILALFLPALLSGWIGFDYPNETVTWRLLAGGGLITLANVLLQLKPSSAKASEGAAA
jgi:drug/metabolite transporter (DMT)-like permease